MILGIQARHLLNPFLQKGSEDQSGKIFPRLIFFKIRAKSIDHPLFNNKRNRSYRSFIWTCTCIPTAATLQYKLRVTKWQPEFLKTKLTFDRKYPIILPGYCTKIP